MILFQVDSVHFHNCLVVIMVLKVCRPIVLGTQKLGLERGLETAKFLGLFFGVGVIQARKEPVFIITPRKSESERMSRDSQSLTLSWDCDSP
jgi:hypothetical protein